MIKTKKQMFIVIGLFTLVLFIGGVTYAWFTYRGETKESNLVAGDIYLTMTQGNETLTLTNVFPETKEEARAKDDNYITFSLNGLNTSNKTIYYEILLSHGDDKASPKSRYLDSELVFDLAEIDNNGNVIEYVVDGQSYDTLSNTKIWVDTIDAETDENVSRKYMLRAWLSEDVIISDSEPNANYTTTEFPNKYATVKVAVNGDFREKSAHMSLYNIMKKSAVMDNINSEFVQNTTPGINFGAISSDTNGKGVYIRSGTQNDEYPIMYYRGAVEDNNVIFNNKCWKAVRTTDTGGVKLIYNGETGRVYDNIQELSGYSNVTKVTDVSDVTAPFTFDTNDNTWNIELTGASSTVFEFTVPTGDNYNLIMTGTSGSSCGGAMTFYKDGTSVNGTSQGGGNAINLTYSYGSLSSSNIIKMTYDGSSSATCPMTFKIKMEQNSSALANNQYTIVTNGIDTSKKWTFDENSKKWYTIVPSGSSTKITFSVASDGFYRVKYTANEGPIIIKKGENYLSTSNGTDYIIDLGNALTSDVYSIEYQQMAQSSGKIEFALQNDLGIGCDNSGAASQIGTSYFNTYISNYYSPAYNGYMYGEVYKYNKIAPTSGAYFGNSFTWDGANYTLTNAKVGYDGTHHYTCNLTTAEGTCTEIRYYYYVDYYVKLTGGDSIETALKKMQTNTNNSIAKTQIDNWYSTNMTSVTNKLEDIIWCNDRSVGDNNNNGWIANGGDLYTSLHYGAYQRSNYASGTSTVKNQPSLACANKNDRFTVNNGNGNQALDYPTALLTEDEIVLAGGVAGKNNGSIYLTSGESWWSMSPSSFPADYAYGFSFGLGSLYTANVNVSIGLRPVVSLKSGTTVASGTGTVADPYVIE